MLGLGTSLVKGGKVGRAYVKDGLKLYMPHRGDNITKGTQFVGEGSTSFDGGDYIDCGTGLGTALGDNYSGSLSMSLWFKADVTSGSDGLFDIVSGFGGSVSSMFRVRMDSNNLEFWLNEIGWMREYSFSDTSSWHHLVVIYNTGGATDSKMYLDGVAVGTIDGTYNTFPDDADMDFSGKNTIIGACYSSSYAFDGIINEVSLWGTEFTLAQVQELFNDGVPLDATTHSVHTSASTNLKGYWRNDGASTWTDRSTDYSNNGTPSGSPDTILLPEGTTSGKDILGFPLTHTNNGWLNIAGSNTRTGVIIPYSSVLERKDLFTISFWIKMDKLTNLQNIIAKYDGDNTASREWAVKYITDGGGSIRLDDGGNHDLTAATIDDGNWNYVVIVANGTTSKIHWYNSSGVLSSSSNFTLATITTGASPITIGGLWDNSDGLLQLLTNDRNFEGSIDEVMYHAKALSATEIEKNYKHGKSKHS